MQALQHTNTLATVVRAGDTTTLLSLADRYGGLILAPAATRVITAATGLPIRELPGTLLLVEARLDAVYEGGLALQDWRV
ncbi:hypothetical protein [Streptomyces sp. NPDC055287]